MTVFNPPKVMLDLETLGTRPGDTILSIGACVFDIELGISTTFYKTISQESSKEAGFRATKSTIEFWGKQAPAVRAEAFKGEFSVKEVLEAFAAWVPSEGLLYGNGASFDNVLLSAAYRQMKMEQPWKYWNDRCFRTIKNMFMKYKVERVGMEHHALDDAKHQALQLIQMAKENNLRLI